MEIFTIWMLVCWGFLFSWRTACGEEASPLVQRHTFALGFGLSHFDNVEPDALPSMDDIEKEGPMYSVMGEYTYHNQIMMSAGIEYSVGDQDYDGYVWNLVTNTYRPEETDADGETVECRALIGYDLVLWKNHVVTPFLGLGYRYWHNDLKGGPGYAKEVEYWYSPIGIRTHSPLSDKWTWGMSAEYDLFFEGEVDTDIPQMPTFHEDSGCGARFSLTLARRLTEDLVLAFEPYVTYWDVDESDGEIFLMPQGSGPAGYSVIPVVEPDNETTTYGLRVRLEF